MRTGTSSSRRNPSYKKLLKSPGAKDARAMKTTTTDSCVVVRVVFCKDVCTAKLPSHRHEQSRSGSLPF